MQTETETPASEPVALSQSKGETRTPEPAGDPLHDLLAQRTEEKLPGSGSDFSGWTFDEDPEPETRNAEPEPGTRTPERENTGTGRITDATVRASAETSTLLFDGLITTVGQGVLNSKFKKRFTPEELRTIIEKDFEDKKQNEIEEQHRVLKRKFDRLLAKRDRKSENIPLSEDERKNVFQSFYNYYKVKNMTMPPEALLIFTLGGILVDRTLEITMD